MSYEIKPWHIAVVIGIISVVAFGLWFREPASTVSNYYPVRTAEAEGVEISVQPDLIGEEWAFAVSMNTHAGDLSEDLSSAALRLGGREYEPLRWEGDPPGGHHRTVTLFFAPVEMSPTFTLVIRNVGGVKERIFEWNNDQ
jgi:hypothetical protein